jgi:hypothetical protein
VADDAMMCRENAQRIDFQQLGAEGDVAADSQSGRLAIQSVVYRRLRLFDRLVFGRPVRH